MRTGGFVQRQRHTRVTVALLREGVFDEEDETDIVEFMPHRTAAHPSLPAPGVQR